jgi:hypothetical protein
MGTRDEFSEAVKRDLCDRVQGLCSKPDCRVPTKGPRADSTKAKSIGRASHIHAAAEGGPRYNSHQFPEERSSFDNGIWLCANHAAEVDADDLRFTADELLRWKHDAELYADASIGKSQLAAGPTAARGMIAIGPHVLAFGRVLKSARGLWSVALDEFVLGDIVALRHFADSFAEASAEDCFVCIEADGVGRLLVDAPSIDLTAGIVVELRIAAPLPLAEAREKFDANLRGPDLALDLSGDVPDMDPLGREVSGAETIPQALLVHLSTCKGGYCVGGDAGSRVAEWNASLGPRYLISFIAIETIRLATVPHADEAFGRTYVPFDFVERVRGVRLLPSTVADFLKAAITLDVHGVGKNKEFVVPISTSTEHLGTPPPFPSFSPPP